MAIDDSHAASVKKLNRRVGRTFGDAVVVGVQDPIRLLDSEPEPDISLLVPRDDFYESGKPRPADILLLIEVADTSLEFDRETKLPLYAQAGIRELWIVNLIERCLEVHRDPTPDGQYRDISVLRPVTKSKSQRYPDTNSQWPTSCKTDLAAHGLLALQSRPDRLLLRRPLVRARIAPRAGTACGTTRRETFSATKSPSATACCSITRVPTRPASPASPKW